MVDDRRISTYPPTQALDRISENGLRWLLNEYDGDLLRAAYRLAWLKNAANSYTPPTPTGNELYGAARRIATACDVTMQPKIALIKDARALGLDIL